MWSFKLLFICICVCTQYGLRLFNYLIYNFELVCNAVGTVTPNLVPPKSCPAWALIGYKLYTVEALGLGLGWGLVLMKR